MLLEFNGFVDIVKSLYYVFMTSSAEVIKLKNDYVNYFKDVPVQKYAAMFIGRDEDTIIRWKKEDSEFADAVMKSKAEWIRKKVLATKAEFALERLASEVFSPKAITSTETDQKENPHKFLRELAETVKLAHDKAYPTDIYKANYN